MQFNERSLDMINKTILMLCGILVLSSAANAHNEVVSTLVLPTSETTGKQIVLLDVGHRYLDVNRHTTNVNISFGYGITSGIDAYVGYSFKNKDTILSSKVNILNDLEDKGSILSLALVAGGGYKDINEINNSASLSYMDSKHVKSVHVLDKKDRISYFVQIPIEKHLYANRVWIGIVPTYAYNTNFYGIKSSKDYTFGTGIALTFFFTDHFAVCGETIMNINGFAFKYMNYNAGLKYAGYRHTFALWISNSSGYSPVEYVVGSAVKTPKICFSFSREFDI
jgi:hypothetical protein